MLSMILAATLQASPSAADMDARFNALKAQTNAVTAAVDASTGPKPVPKNGAIFGVYRVEIETEAMTDERTISITTKALGAGKRDIHLTVQCEGGSPLFLYYFDRPVFTRRSTLTGRMRIDQNPMRLFGGNQSRDNRGVWIDSDFLDLGVTSAAEEGQPARLPIMDELSVGSRLRMQADPDAGTSTDHSFSLRGFANAVRVLPCVK